MSLTVRNTKEFDETDNLDAEETDAKQIPPFDHTAAEETEQCELLERLWSLWMRLDDGDPNAYCEYSPDEQAIHALGTKIFASGDRDAILGLEKLLIDMLLCLLKGK